MSWLCVERVLDENERGKLENSLCFPSPSLLPRIFHCRYLKPFSLKTELAYIPQLQESERYFIRIFKLQIV